jgi:hypothetical protein
MSLEVCGWFIFSLGVIFTFSTIFYEFMMCSSFISISEAIKKYLSDEEKPIKRDVFNSMYV